MRWIRAMVLVAASTMAADAMAAAEWPAWQRFADRFVQADGRVVDLTFEAKSTSEGQSYGLFFALVANDRARFDTMLKWTSRELAGGRLGPRLPAWHWGRRADGSWGVKDPNAAADADLWLAYTLLEAGRLWQEPAYSTIGRELLEQVRQLEVVRHGKAEHQLLPGPYGFVLDGGRLRINPSYLPGFQLIYLAEVDPDGPWRALRESYLALAPQLFAAGVAPDMSIVDARGRVRPDSERGPVGSYDAIRVYLWAGMTPADSALLLRLLKPFAQLIDVHGAPPEQVDARTGAVLRAEYSPSGFAGAVLPFLDALGETRLLAAQRARVAEAQRRGRAGAATNYYDDALILFGQGWDEHRYRFDARGRLQPHWAAAIAAR